MKKLEIYVEEFEKSRDKVTTLEKILLEMLGEVNELQKTRNAQTSDALLAVVKDITDRWERFCEEVEILSIKHSLLKCLRRADDGEFLYSLLVKKYPQKRILV